MTSVVTGIALLGDSYSAVRHHRRARSDAAKVFTIMGTVSSFQFSNPHVHLFLDVKDNKGEIEKWIGEDISPNLFVQEHWDSKTIKTGDQIAVTGHPARNGTNAMRIEKVVLPNGRKLTFEGPGGM